MTIDYYKVLNYDRTMRQENIPNPGSKEAVERGCSCPIMDNSYGKGYYGKPAVFIITVGCQLHDNDRADKLQKPKKTKTKKKKK